MIQKLSSENNAINWFEIPVLDLERAKAFYEAILDIELTALEGEGNKGMVFFPRKKDTIMAMSGVVSGALVKNEQAKPSAGGPLIYLNASPFLDTEKIEKAGGRIVAEKVKIPAGYICVIIDTEGNKVALHAEA